MWNKFIATVWNKLIARLWINFLATKRNNCLANVLHNHHCELYNNIHKSHSRDSVASVRNDCRQFRCEKRGHECQTMDANAQSYKNSPKSPKRAKLSSPSLESPPSRLVQLKIPFRKLEPETNCSSSGHSQNSLYTPKAMKTTNFYGNRKKLEYVNPLRRKCDFGQNGKVSCNPPSKTKRSITKKRPQFNVGHKVKKPRKTVKKAKKISKKSAKIQVELAACTTVENETRATENESGKKKFFRNETPRLTVLNAVTLGKHKIQFSQGVRCTSQSTISRKPDCEREQSEESSIVDDSPTSTDKEMSGKNLQSSKCNNTEEDEFLNGELTGCKVKTGTRSSKPKPGWHQSIIDAGQKEFGTKQCGTCGMVYTLRDEDDELLHVQFHNGSLSAIKFNGWKNERVVREYIDGRVLMILPEDAKYVTKKLTQVMDVMNVDLGFTDCSVLDRKFKAFLFVSYKKIIGCIIAEEIDKGFRINVEDGKQALCCSTESEPAFCGINRVWTCVAYRRKRIATRLLECVCGHYYYGHVLTPSQVAFSDPTPVGIKLACSFNSNSSFLVYKLST